MNASYKPFFAPFVDNMIHEMSGLESVNLGPFVGGCDLGVGDRGVLLLGVTDMGSRYHVLYEFDDRGEGLQGLLEQNEDLRWLKPYTIVLGPDGVNRSVHDGRNAVDIIEDMGLGTRISRQSVRSGLSRIRSLITTDPGQCDITIEPRCSRLLDDLRRYAVKHGDRDGYECVTPEASHSVDALRYMVDRAINLQPV